MEACVGPFPLACVGIKPVGSRSRVVKMTMSCERHAACTVPSQRRVVNTSPLLPFTLLTAGSPHSVTPRENAESSRQNPHLDLQRISKLVVSSPQCPLSSELLLASCDAKNVPPAQQVWPPASSSCATMRKHAPTLTYSRCPCGCTWARKTPRCRDASPRGRVPTP